MITLIMMLVISLIVIGFTQVTTRNRREALDKQLSSQAFYAAESGINKAAASIKASLISGVAITQKSTCPDDGTYNRFSLSDDNVAVTCIMVNTRPGDIRVSAAQNSSTVMHVRSVDATGTSQPLTELTFNWAAQEGQTTDNSNCTATIGEFGKNAGSCGFGLLRIDLLVDVDDPLAVTDPDTLASKTSTFYFQPMKGSALGEQTLTNSDKATKAFIVGAKCDTNTMCSATLRLTESWSKSEFYARLSTLYRDTPTVIIDGALSPSGSAYFDGAQAVIDATGRAQDVLRRVQVRYPLESLTGDTTPAAAVQSGAEICKRFTVWPGGYADNCSTP